MTSQESARVPLLATPFIVNGVVEQYLRIPCALILWYFFFTGALAPFRLAKEETVAAVHQSTLSWCFSLWCAYLCVNGLFITTMFIIENARCLISTRPVRLSLTEDYVRGDPPKVDKMAAFDYDTPIDAYEWVKIFVFVATGVAFVRAVTATVTVFLGLFTASVAGYLDRDRHPWWFGFWYRVTALLSLIAFATIGIYNFRLYGVLAPRSECKILIASHSCVLEVVWLYITAGFPSFVSRRENLSIAFFGTVVRASSSILVDRDAATSRERTLAAILQRAEDPAAPQLMVFPEGTTTNQQTLFQFKKGVFEAAAPVQMVCIAFPYRHFNPAWTGRGVGGNAPVEILLRTSCQFVNYAEARLLPVYYPTEEEKKDSKLYATHCQKMMATVLQENISDATFADYVEAYEHFAKLKKSR